MHRSRAIIRKAIEVLDGNFWGRGTLKRANGGRTFYCAMGALREARKVGHLGEWDLQAAYGRVEEAILLRGRAPGPAVESATLPHWNDKVAKDKEDVIGLFREALDA